MNIICGWHVANSILEKSFEEENYITALKLNYLVYLLYSEYLYLNGEGLFNELFEKTELGPVVPSVYSKFNLFSNQVITKYAKDSTGRTRGITGNTFNESLSRVWEKFKNMDNDIILSYIESGYYYSRREEGETLTQADMLIDEISRKEEELEKEKNYIKKFTRINPYNTLSSIVYNQEQQEIDNAINTLNNIQEQNCSSLTKKRTP